MRTLAAHWLHKWTTKQANSQFHIKLAPHSATNNNV